jgi:signal transduction histidine kinase
MENELEQLKTENEKLKKTNAVKSDVISISAHQLRTSLSALKWILKMFLDKDVGPITTEQEGFIQKAFNSNERMIALVNDLLTLNHTEDAEIKFNFKKVDPLYLVEQTIFEFSGETAKKEVALVFLKPDAPIPMIMCDEEMTRVVLQNLIENALKYSNKGDKVFVSLKYNEEKKIVEFSVHDTGIGIEEKDKAQIFQKFFRTDNAKEKEIVGSGLGLYATKNIVERHKGTIWFESSKEKGTTFFVSLPLE